MPGDFLRRLVDFFTERSSRLESVAGPWGTEVLIAALIVFLLLRIAFAVR
jgi:hypothetical protein